MTICFANAGSRVTFHGVCVPGHDLLAACMISVPLTAASAYCERRFDETEAERDDVR